MKVIIKAFIVFIIVGTSFSVYATTYKIGPNQAYPSIGSVPTHDLQAGDTVMVYYKTTPYYEKFLLAGIGTLSNPIVFMGVPDENGNKPILDGQNAVSSTLYDFWNEERQIIKVGQGDNSDNIIIDGFIFRNANNKNTFIDDQGNTQAYQANACGVRPENCTTITVRNCEVYDCGNGFQGGSPPQIFTIEKCYIHDNGQEVDLSSVYEHNIYAAGGAGTVLIIQYCRIGDLYCDSQSLKSRSETNIIRFNWIEGGLNGQLDLVDHADNGPSNSYVYGNVIIKTAPANNGRMILWGQDNGNSQNAVLYFYNNTCINNFFGARYFDLNDAGRTLLAQNNIFYNSTASSSFGNFVNAFSGSNNWLSKSIYGANLLTASITGTNPEFVDYSNQDYHLTSTSACVNVVTEFSTPDGYALNKQYLNHMSYIDRTVISDAMDLGAYESIYLTGMNENDNLLHDIIVYPNSSNGVFYVKSEINISKIDIVNMLGEIIYSAQINSDRAEIDLSKHANGIYLYQIQGDRNNLKTGEIIIL